MCVCCLLARYDDECVCLCAQSQRHPRAGLPSSSVSSCGRTSESVCVAFFFFFYENVILSGCDSPCYRIPNCACTHTYCAAAVALTRPPVAPSASASEYTTHHHTQNHIYYVYALIINIHTYYVPYGVDHTQSVRVCKFD